MLIDAMTKQECREVLAHVSFGRLACSLRDQPYVVPVCLACEPDNIYVSSNPGKKIEWMRANPRVIIQVDEIADQSRWASVIVNGWYEELHEIQYAAEREHARRLLEKRSLRWLDAFAERQFQSGDKLIELLFLRVCPRSITGARAAEAIGESGWMKKSVASVGALHTVASGRPRPES
jgi:nitroimidazol reductase NimA-like FMN-containing flavoprotein (pyridoxamine 5'-phosphate oxidase superfamily)